MRRTTALFITVAIGLGACSSSSQTASTATGGATATTAAPAVTFPVTVTADNGQIAIPTRPARILSLSATATEMIYGIGAGAQVAAVDQYSTDPPNAPRTKFTGYESSAEAYVPQHPDLVILAFDTGGHLASQLATLHIPTLVLGPAKSLDDTYRQYNALGAATGHVDAASAEVARIKSQLAAIVTAVGGHAKGLTYYHEVDNTLYTATSKTFIGALYGSLGMVNVADAADKAASGYPQLSAEYLVKADPQYVILADTTCCQQTAATLAARPGFAGLQAIKQHHVLLVPDAIAAQWGPRVVDFLRDIAAGVDPAAVPSLPPVAPSPSTSSASSTP